MNLSKTLLLVASFTANVILGDQVARSEGLVSSNPFFGSRKGDDLTWNSRGSLWLLDTVNGDFRGAEVFLPSFYWRGQSFIADFEFCSVIKDDKQSRSTILGSLSASRSVYGSNVQHAVLGYGWRGSHIVSAMKGKYDACPLLFDEADSLFPIALKVKVSRDGRYGHRLRLYDRRESMTFTEDETFHALASSAWRLSTVDAPQMPEKVCGSLSFDASGAGVFRCCNSVEFKTKLTEEGHFRAHNSFSTAVGCGQSYRHQNDAIASTALHSEFSIGTDGKLIAENAKYRTRAVFEPVSWYQAAQGKWQLAEVQDQSQRLGAPLDLKSKILRDDDYDGVTLQVQKDTLQLDTKCDAYFAPIVDARKGILRLGRSKNVRLDIECRRARSSALQNAHLFRGIIANKATITFDHTLGTRNPTGRDMLRVTRNGGARAVSWTFFRLEE